MASSKVMASSSSANSDLARQPSMYSLKVPGLEADQGKNLGSMSMDELLRNIYGEDAGAGEGEANGGGIPVSQSVGNKMEDVWKDIVAGRGGAGGSGGGGGDDRKIIGGGVVVGEEQYYEDAAPSEGITLEDFLAKRGAVIEEDVRIPQPTAGLGQGMFGVDPLLTGRFQQQQQVDGSVLAFGNGVEGVGVGKGKRRALQYPIDKVAQQKQRRMIKNRESAARSRERKQAYTVELESLVTQLVEENERLVKEQEEHKKQRFKQLMENLIPVEEKRRAPRVLRRVRSLHW